MEFWRTFCKDGKNKSAPNSTITPGYPGGYVVLTCCMLILCCECQAKADGGRLLFLGVANKFRNGNKARLRKIELGEHIMAW